MARIIVTLLLSGKNFREVSQQIETELSAFGAVSVNKGGGHALFTVQTSRSKVQVREKLNEFNFPGTILVGEEENDNKMVSA